jgi:hypothetical protein
VQREWPKLCSNYRILDHDNAPADKVLFIKQFLTKKSIAQKGHPLYDFWLFPKIKSALKG